MHSSARLKLSEWHVYGNESQGRFVTRYPEHEVFHQWNLSTNEQNNIFSRNLGFKAYELKDHLGNVRVTVSDVKIPNGTSFLADMITKNEYYPFGMLIDGQSVNPTNYRYSFNTQEISTEINQNHTTAEFWEYDSRSGRRWNFCISPYLEAGSGVVS